MSETTQQRADRRERLVDDAYHLNARRSQPGADTRSLDRKIERANDLIDEIDDDIEELALEQQQLEDDEAEEEALFI